MKKKIVKKGTPKKMDQEKEKE